METRLAFSRGRSNGIGGHRRWPAPLAFVNFQGIPDPFSALLKGIRLVLIVLASLAVVVVILFSFRGEWRERGLKKQSEPIQAALETYRQQHGRYPDSMSQVGFAETEEGPLHYDRKSETAYILWYGLTLGESRVFNSMDRQWH